MVGCSLQSLASEFTRARFFFAQIDTGKNRNYSDVKEIGVQNLVGGYRQ